MGKIGEALRAIEEPCAVCGCPAGKTCGEYSKFKNQSSKGLGILGTAMGVNFRVVRCPTPTDVGEGSQR